MLRTFYLNRKKTNIKLLDLRINKENVYGNQICVNVIQKKKEEKYEKNEIFAILQLIK